MVTWPIYLALVLSITAVYLSLQSEEKQAKEIDFQKEKDRLKKLDLLNRKTRIENEKKQSAK